MAFFFLLDKVLAFVRQILNRASVRAFRELDAFNVANNVP
jgi:hypothetical protein